MYLFIRGRQNLFSNTLKFFFLNDLGILRGKTMDEKFIYIPNDNKHNHNIVD